MTTAKAHPATDRGDGGTGRPHSGISIGGTGSPRRWVPQWNGRRFATCVAAVSAAWMVMLGAHYSVLGLADIRGGLGIGFDEGSWLSTAYKAGDVVGVVIGCWLATAISLKRVLLHAAFLFMTASGVLALSPTFTVVLIARTAQGLAGGSLLPMAIVALLRTLPPHHRALALALYTSASTLAPQLAAGLVALLINHWGWTALFWANLIPGLIALGTGAYGLPHESFHGRPLLYTDRFGLLLLVLGVAMLACGFDQGDPLDWLHSALIRALLVGGTVAFGLSIVYVARLKRDLLLNMELLWRPNISMGTWGVLPFGLAALGCTYVIPQFLVQAHAYRPDELWLVLQDAAWPQVISYIAAVVCLGKQWFGPRRLLALGFLLVGAGLLIESLGLDGAWTGPDLWLGQVLQGLGLPLILLTLLFLFVGDLLPREGLHAAMLFNIMRSLGGTIGLAGVATLDRVREQARSSFLVDHVTAGSLIVSARLDALTAAVSARSLGDDQAQARALHILAIEVRQQAQILGHADTLAALAIAVLVFGSLCTLCLRPNGSGHPDVGARAR